MSRSKKPRKPSDKDRFARQMMQSLRAAGETGEIRYDRSAYTLAGARGHISLGNAYDLYCHAPADRREEVIRQFTRAWFINDRPIPESFEDARTDILPIVRERAFFEWLNPGMPHLHLDRYHAIGLVYDFPEVTVHIDDEMLRKWGASFLEAFDAAIRNLRELIQPTKFGQHRGGYWSVASEDHYGPSRVLVPEVFDGLRLKGGPAVMLPCRNVLLIAGADDTETLTAMAETAWSRSERFFWSGIPTRFADGRWAPFRPSADHPAAPTLRKLKLRSLSRDYGWQRDVMETVHLREGYGVYVTNFSVMQDPETGEPSSYCVWSEGVPAMLPRTELIHFTEHGFQNTLDPAQAFLVRWETAQRVVGHLMTPVDLYPKRYQVEQFPSHEQQQELRSESLRLPIQESGKPRGRNDHE